MKNVKSVIVLKPVYGLHVDAVLTRNSNEENFVYETAYAGADHTHNTKIELSESLIDKEYFASIEWFEAKPLTNREKIAQLEKKVDELQKKLDLSEEERIAAVTAIKEKSDYTNELYKSVRDKYEETEKDALASIDLNKVGMYNEQLSILRNMESILMLLI